MAFEIKRADYFHLTVPAEPDKACRLLHDFAELGVNLLAFSAVPIGPETTQLTVFPEDAAKLKAVAKRERLDLDGPHGALMFLGDDELGALAKVHERLREAGVDVYASSGMADGHGKFGYVVYVRGQALERAVTALDV